jgi:hypothetical protein
MATTIEQLDAMRRLAENWDGYGAAAPRSEVIDLAQAFVGLAEAAIRRRLAPNEGILYVSPTRIGGVLIEWEDALKEHEVELCPDGSIGFLHLDKQTKQITTREFAPGAPSVFTPDLLAELQHLWAA